MATFISKSPEQTQRLGEIWGREAQPGWLIGLQGDLGAGKTQLVKGLARGLGVTEPVRSPTFTLVHQYVTGRLPLVHLDFYRLETPAEIQTAGLAEYLDCPAGVTVVEWIDRWIQSPRSEAQGPKSKVQRSPAMGHKPEPAFIELLAGLAALPARCRCVLLEWAGETERHITYEDTGA